MSARHIEVVGLDRDLGDDRLDKVLPRASSPSVRQLNPNQQFGGGYSGYDDIVLIGNQTIQACGTALGRDQDARVEDQSFQRSPSSVTNDRSSDNSSAQKLSGGVARRMALTTRPLAPLAGSRRAMTLPLREITKLSLLCSTASSTSEKRREASVAVMSFIENQII